MKVTNAKPITALVLVNVCILTLFLIQGKGNADDKSNKDAQSLKLSSLEIVNKKGEVVISLACDAAGGGVVTMNGPRNNLVVIGVGDFGQTALGLYSKTGNPIIELGETLDGNGQVRVMSKDTTSFLDLGFDETSNPAVRVVRDGKIKKLDIPD